MKRVFPWLFFIAAIEALAILLMAPEARDTDLLFRVGLWSVIGVLSAWKLGDFWKRHRRAEKLDPPEQIESDAVSPDR